MCLKIVCGCGLSGRFTLALVDKDSLLPLAWLLVGPVNAACPAAGPPLPFKQLLTGSLDTTPPRCWLLCVFDPTNKLVATQRCQALPKGKCVGIRSHGCLQIRMRFMSRSVEKIVCHKAKAIEVMPHDQLEPLSTHCFEHVIDTCLHQRPCAAAKDCLPRTTKSVCFTYNMGCGENAPDKSFGTEA
jgi:hypothetical protein